MPSKRSLVTGEGAGTSLVQIKCITAVSGHERSNARQITTIIMLRHTCKKKFIYRLINLLCTNNYSDPHIKGKTNIDGVSKQSTEEREY